MYIDPCILSDFDEDADNKVINEYTYWSFSIKSIETARIVYFEYGQIDDKQYNTCEEAAHAGIEYVIDNLI